MAITKATTLANFASGITGIGSVGIGTTDPRLDLEINGDVRLSDNSPRLFLYDANATGASSATGGFEVFDKDGNKNVFVGAFAPDADNLIFGVTGSERLRITSAGNIGIGTENPLNGVDIVQSDSRTRVTAYGHIITRNHNHSVTNYWSIAPRNGGELDIAYGSPDGNGTVAADLVTIKTDGNLGVGLASPLSKTHIKGGSLTIEHGSPSTGTCQLNINSENNSQVSFSFDDQGHISFGSAATPHNQGSFSEKLRIRSAGGITFNGDTAAANALDDYEEGTLGWRLQRNNAIGSGSNHSDTSIRYTKIGNRVYVSGYLYTVNTGSSTGVLAELRDDSNVNSYATLPYVPNQAGGFPITGTRTLDDTYRNMAVTFRHGQSQVYIYNDDGNNAYLKNSNNVNIGSTQTHLVIQFCGSYTTDS